MSRVFYLAFIAILQSLISACAAAQPVNPPDPLNCEELKNIYIIDHGLHTGIVVKRDDLASLLPFLENDFTESKYLEIGWGDALFYQAPAPTIGLAMQAMLWPTASVLHLVAIPESPQHTFPQLGILKLSVPEPGYRKMLQYIEETFARTYDGQITRFGAGLYGDSWFYQANGSFHAFNTCNTWVAGAIQTTGFPLSSEGVIRAENLLRQLKRRITPESQCFSVD